MGNQQQVVVIGAGIGGLTAGALLLHAGYRVTILEAHIYPGGSAGTFYHQKYRFDAGATLAGGFAPGGPHARLADILGLEWPIDSVNPAWVVHMPDGRTVTQWADPQAWQAEWQEAFPGTGGFWQIQSLLADISWDLSTRPFPWPPSSLRDLSRLAAAVRPQTLRALPYLNRTVADLAPARPDFQLFLDAQLLIAAQTTADRANALYGSAALDLPRRGVNQVRGGIGALAQSLAAWIRSHGGEIQYRQQVERIEVQKGKAVAVQTNKGQTVACDWLIANLTPWALRKLLAEAAPARLAQEVEDREATWGAFTLYLGLEEKMLPPGIATHHQVIAHQDRPLGEGNSVFISLSDPGDQMRAPAGKRAATLSTHTAVAPWWDLRREEKADAYKARKQQYTERMLLAAEQAIPGIHRAAELVLPGTPVTFQFYTRRPGGMVGGFPQTNLFKVRGPQTGIPNLRLVGDSIFPGQSTAGVTLGAMRVAADVIDASRSKLFSRIWLPGAPWHSFGKPHSTLK